MIEMQIPTARNRLRFRAVDRATASLQRALALEPEVLASIYTRLDAEKVMAEAAALDADPVRSRGPLAGLTVSIKDLFDEAGEITGAGSRALAGGTPAQADAEAVRRLKAAGALTVGRTAMSEFAYSGIGLNPHFGDPGNARDRTRISGGSSSGGGLTVAYGLADVALGSDTGGSVRIPAAFNGLCGFKPTQSTVPLDGAFPLSGTYDSIGPIARRIATCAQVHAVLSGESPPLASKRPMRLGIVRGPMTDGLDDTVAAAFEAALAALAAAGFELADTTIEHAASAGPVNRVIVASEAHRIHEHRLDHLETVGDPRVLKRIRAATTFAANEEADARALRASAVEAFGKHPGGFDAFLAPTIAIVAPTIADAAADFDRLNALVLRNPSVVNFLDGCAATVPMGGAGDLSSGLMIFAPGGADWIVLDIAERLAPLVAPA